DDGVGRLLDYLDESGLAENTIVIYSSDQGFYLGDHGWYDKRWMYEESLKMPLMVRWPGAMRPGIVSDALVQNIDYGPTFLDVAGAEIPAEMQGRSLVPLLRGGGDVEIPWRDAIYYAYYENAAVHAVPIHDGVRTKRYKLMYFPRGDQWNLYDLEKDPDELQSVHDHSDYADVLVAMVQRYNEAKSFYEVNSAAIPQTRGDEAWWAKRDRAKREITRTQKDCKVVFLGDSITQAWEGKGKDVWNQHYLPHRAVNLGFSGDRTEHLLWRLRKNSLGKIQPRVAVVMIGTNNTGHKMQSPKQVADGVAVNIEELRQRLPNTKIILHGVFPRGASPDDKMRINNDAINLRIAKLHDGKHVFYLDIGKKFLDEKGTLSRDIMPDLLHLNAKGYEIWANALDPLLNRLLDE
ncbi:MAG: sulfatase/phosphatase domain-containing protein, partial [Planctomycetota bacterium]